MKFTITSNLNNDILRVITLDNRLLDAFEADVDTIKSDFLAAQLQPNETAHSGGFPVSHYTFDGTDFTRKVQRDYVPPSLRNPSELLVMLVQQLLDAGLALPLHRDFIRTKAQAKDLIDQAAGRARARNISQGIAIEEEYNQAKRQSAWFIDNPTATAPSMVKTWSLVSGRTDLDAAIHITGTATGWELMLDEIYHIRLTGKAAVDADLIDFIATAKLYIDQLDAL